MAILWGGLSNRLEVGVEWWVLSGPDANGRVYVAINTYMRTNYTYYNYDGTISGSLTSVSPWSTTKRLRNSDAILMNSWTEWYTAQYGSARTISISLSGTATGAGPASVATTLTLPARQYDAPAAPTGVTATLVSDTKANLSWSISSTTAAPVQAQGVERWDAQGGVWMRVATLPGSARSWTDTQIAANNRYWYRVWGDSGSKAGPKTESAGFSTTPAAPTGVEAVKNEDHSITITWTNKAPYGGTGFQVLDNGALVGTTAAGATSYAHASPDPSVSHTYTVRMTETGGLVSAPSSPSNTVVILTNPGAPTDLSPVGVAPTGVVSLSWSHTAIDSSAQTSARVRYRRSGATDWVTVSVSDGSMSTQAGLAAGAWEWQVRTWGAYQPGQESGASPWSALASLTVADVPGVAIQSPADGTVYTPTVTPGWTFFQTQGSVQVAAEVVLVDADGVTVEARTVTGAGTSLLLATALTNGGSYTVRVRARSGDGLWSPWDEAGFTVAFPAPPAPMVGATWYEVSGLVAVSISNPEPDPAADPVPPAATSNMVERSVDGGATWEMIADGVDVYGSVTDAESLSHGTTLYRVTATSDLPSSAATIVELVTESWSLWISGGDGFTVSVALPWNPVHSLVADLKDRAIVYMAGRSRPLELSGVQTSRSVAISATLTDDEYADIETLAQLATMPAPFLYRDPMGRRIYGSLSGLSLPRALTGLWDVKATITEVDR